VKPKLGRAGRPAPSTPEDAIAKARLEKEVLEEETRQIEEELEALKARYEMYFLGVERKEPVRWREEVRRRVLKVKEAFTQNTGLKFRIQTLHARYLSYERLWLRSAREKEEGTYRRDLFKARLRARRDQPAQGAQPAPAQGAGEADPAKAPPEQIATRPADGQIAAAPAAARRGATESRTPIEKPAPPAVPAGSMDDAQMRALYAAYIAAKKSCNEDVSRLTYDAVARSVSKQIPDIMARFKAKSVEFKVEVKAGKAVLKAVPKV
jgi:hypothetical protein